MKNLTFEEVKSLLNSPKRIIIVTHYNPDGDAIGSSLGLNQYLNLKGHISNVIVPNDYPDFLKWIYGASEIINFEIKPQNAIQLINNSEIIFTLDFNALHRAGKMKNLLEKNESLKIMIDHHEMPGSYAHYKYSDNEISSTAEMIYNFIERMNDVKILNKSICTALYTGMMTDTASFRFPKVTAKTHQIISKFLEIGVNHSEIHDKVYSNIGMNKIKILGIALKNLKLIQQHSIAYTTLSQKNLDENNFKKGDTEGLVNYGLSIDKVKMSVIFIENKFEGIIKISFRSRGKLDVNKFARKYFSGGGHKNAAGGKSELTLDECVKQFRKVVEDYIF